MRQMMASVYQARDPFLTCRTLDGGRVHLRVEVPYHKLALCGRVVFRDGVGGDPRKLRICPTCLWKAGG